MSTRKASISHEPDKNIVAKKTSAVCIPCAKRNRKMSGRQQTIQKDGDNEDNFFFEFPMWMSAVQLPSEKSGSQILNSVHLLELHIDLNLCFTVFINTRERIGALILASRYYGAVVGVASNVSLISVLIGTVTPTLSQVAVGIDQKPTLSASDISVTLV